MAAGKIRIETDEAKVDLTPMIDIVFNLLIFFLCATKFRSTEGLIMCFLPKNRGQGSGTPTIDLNEVRIKLLWYDGSGKPSTADEGYCVVKIADQSFNNPGELEGMSIPENSPVWEAMFQKLEAFKAGYKGTGEKGLPVIIDSRKQVPTKYVVCVLNQVVRAGLQDVTFAAPEIEY